MSRPKELTVACDAFPDSPFRYLEFDAIVCIDVMRTTTTLVTAAASGRRAFPVASSGQAQALGESLGDVLFGGDRDEHPGIGFEVDNSPAELARRQDLGRPLVLTASAGAELILNSAGCANVYVSCFRNLSATADSLARQHQRVAVLAAGSHGQLRCEDQMAAAWLVAKLMQRGFNADSNSVSSLVGRWQRAEIGLARLGSSAEQLRRAGRSEDLEFILAHIDDLPQACRYERGEVRMEEADVLAAGPVARELASRFSSPGRSAPRHRELAAAASASSRSGHARTSTTS